MDDLAALQVFRAVADLGGFAAAARRMDLSPSAVSKAVAGLEARLGARLINRTTRRMSLTDEGHIYLAQIAPALDALAMADEAMGQIRSRPRGTLRVSAPMTVGLTRLSPAIPAFLDRYPDLSLDLHLDDAKVDLVADGFDVVLRGAANLGGATVIARRLAEMRHVICATPGYLAAHGTPRHPADLAKRDMILFSHNRAQWDFTRGDRVETVTLSGRYTVSSGFAIIDALRAGFGLALIPQPYVVDDLSSGRLVSVLDDWQTTGTTLYAVYPSRQHVPPKTRVFVDFLVDLFDAGPTRTR